MAILSANASISSIGISSTSRIREGIKMKKSNICDLGGSKSRSVKYCKKIDKVEVNIYFLVVYEIIYVCA